MILFSSCLHWLFHPSAARLLLDSGHMLWLLIVAAAAIGTAGIRGWRVWDGWHCMVMVTFCRAALHGFLQDSYSRFRLYLPGISLSKIPQSRVTCYRSGVY